MTETVECIQPSRLFGDIRRTDRQSKPIDDGEWYHIGRRDSGIVYTCDTETLSEGTCLFTDLLLDARTIARFRLVLHSEETGRRFRFTFRTLPLCGARVRIPLRSLDAKQGLYPREGATFKRIAGGDSVDPGQVTRIELHVKQIAPTDSGPEMCLAPVRVATDVPPLTNPALPDGPLIDDLGQSRVAEWDGRTESGDQLERRLLDQAEAAARAGSDEDRTSWGDPASRGFDATGFFRVQSRDGRWWFVDPEGDPFWSVGVNCARKVIETTYDGIESALSWIPCGEEYSEARLDDTGLQSINYLAANFIRAFGATDWQDHWERIVANELCDLGFNTVANWSDEAVARIGTLPHVRSIDLHFERTPTIYRDFPDVYADAFVDECYDLAAELATAAEDPRLIGYFIGNEPQWSHTDEPPAAAALYETETCATRRQLRETLRRQYESDQELRNEWGMEVSFNDIARGTWDEPLSDEARRDLARFSESLVNRLCATLKTACETAVPDHLNLGIRYPGPPPEWAEISLAHFDVFTVNWYDEHLPDEPFASLSSTYDVPVLVGEFHAGALDVGLPSPGLHHVPDQSARGDAYRNYVEDAASKPWCIGCHYFSLYDESWLGRFDGENFNCGLYDVCHRQYEELGDAVRRTNDRIYKIARSDAEPVDRDIEVLPDLY